MNSFSESQKFRQWWLWAILIGSTVLSSSMVYIALLKSGETNAVTVVPVVVATHLLIMGLFLFVELRTTVDNRGVSFQFFPFHFKARIKTWEEIECAYVRKYSPIGEFGGWGIRYTFGNGAAYNVAGSMGLQLVLKNGKKLLIGTQQPDELGEVLNRLNKTAAPPR